MKLETLAKRIAEKAGAPELEECILTGTMPESTECMPWTGRKLTPGVRLRMHRDHKKRPFLGAATVKASAMINYEGRQQYVPRLLHFLITGEDLGSRKMRSICTTDACVNLNHWVVEKAPPVEVPPELSDEWTLPEAIELLEMYLTTNETIDLEHPLLVDLPEPLLREALAELNKEHMIC